MQDKVLMELKIAKSFRNDQKVRDFIDSLFEEDPVIREQHFEKHIEYLVMSKEDFRVSSLAGGTFDLGILKDGLMKLFSK